MNSVIAVAENSNSNSMRLNAAVTLLDSWMGVTDPKKRKMLQNRLNQRAHRRRQRALKPQQQQKNNTQIKLIQLSDSELDRQSKTSSRPHRSLDHVNICGLPLNAQQLQDGLEQLEALIHMEFANGSPTSDLLLGLTQLNIVRALYANGNIIGYNTTDMHDDAVSAFNLEQDVDLNLVCDSELIKTGSNLPVSLQPTITQSKIPHHPWLDLIPIPKMRENLILAGDSYDDLKLCHDMCGYRVSASGILVWKEPWDPSGWEITERFWQIWGWTVRDCWALFESTNKWRMKRGEKPLFGLPRKLPQ